MQLKAYEIKVNCHTRTQILPQIPRRLKTLVTLGQNKKLFTHLNQINKMLLQVLSVQLLLLLATVATAVDLKKLLPIADTNINTGNKVLFEREIQQQQQQNATQTENNSGGIYTDVNEIPVRYDEAQLIRIYNISDRMKNEKHQQNFAETMENKFGGVIWKENSKFLDISIGKEHLKSARGFLLEHNLENEVLAQNVQDLIDEEQLMGVLNTQSVAGQRTKKATRSGMHWKDYQDLEVIYNFMREIREQYPEICRLYTIGKTAEGRDLKVLRISENPSAYKKIWIDGGIHAREWISPATVTYILYKLMQNWNEQPDNIRKRTWYIMPVMNPDGYVYSRTVNRLWRKNRSPSKNPSCKGVDLNRNFDIGFVSSGSSVNPCSDIYRGLGPASELETAAVAKFLRKRRFNLESYLTFHSYGQMIVYPWAYKRIKVKDSSALKNVANKAVNRIRDETNSVYDAGVTHELLGLAGGGSDDWSRDSLGAKFVYTIELRDRGYYGFLLPPNQILGTAKEGLIIMEEVAEAIPLPEDEIPI